MNKEELSAMVAEILSELGPGAKTPEPPQPENREEKQVPDITAVNLRKLYLVEHPADGDKFRYLKQRTPARLGSGKAGARYKTLTMLRFRADHAAAQDTVFSQVPEDYAKNHGIRRKHNGFSPKLIQEKNYKIVRFEPF